MALTKVSSDVTGSTVMPSGAIILWYGSIASIPTGWYLCDGANGTPDLRNKFVIGADADNVTIAKTSITGAATQTGGTKDAILVSHTHTLTDPGHLHAMDADGRKVAKRLGSDAVIDGVSLRAAADDADYSGSQNTGTKTTGITISTDGVSGTNQNLPPYYALAYIMKS
jgi:microcystin-dependent protein